MNTSAIVVLAAAAVLSASPAYAYIDPGTGGMLVQLLTGGIAGLLVIVRLYWQRIRARFGPDDSCKPANAPSTKDR